MPVWTSAQSARDVGQNNDLTGNDEDRVHVYAGEFDGHSIPEGEDHTWSDPGVPLFLTRARGGAFTVYGSLTLSGGLTLQMSQGQGVYVTGEMATDVNAGALPEFSIDDPPEEFVTFEGEQATSGYWKGIAYDDTDSTNNSLAFSVVRHAGSGGAPAATEQRDAAVQVLRGSRLDVRDALVEDTDGYGLFAQLDNELSPLRNTLFRNNEAPVYLYADSASLVRGSTSAENNGTNQVFLRSPIETITEDVVWRDPGVPYRILPSQVDDSLSIGSDAVVRSGVEMRFEQDMVVLVTETGSLATEGSGSEVTEPATVLRGIEESPGYWQGVRFSQTTSEANVVSRTGIYHTGSAPHPNLVETEPKRAAVAATGAAEATVENCHIADYEGAAFAAAFTSNDLREDSVNSTINTSGNVVE